MIAVMLHCVSNRVDMRTRTLGCPAWSSCPPPRVSPRCSPGLYRRLRASWGRGPLQLSLWSHHYTRLENTNRSLEHWWKSKSDQWKQSFKCQTQTFVMVNINKRIHSLIKTSLGWCGLQTSACRLRLVPLRIVRIHTFNGDRSLFQGVSRVTGKLHHSPHCPRVVTAGQVTVLYKRLVAVACCKGCRGKKKQFGLVFIAWKTQVWTLLITK